MLVQKNIEGALGRQYWYSRVLQEQSVDCVGTAEDYRDTRGLCWYSRVL